MIPRGKPSIQRNESLSLPCVQLRSGVSARRISFTATTAATLVGSDGWHQADRMHILAVGPLLVGQAENRPHVPHEELDRLVGLDDSAADLAMAGRSSNEFGWRPASDRATTALDGGCLPQPIRQRL